MTLSQQEPDISLFSLLTLFPFLAAGGLYLCVSFFSLLVLLLFGYSGFKIFTGPVLSIPIVLIIYFVSHFIVVGKLTKSYRLELNDRIFAAFAAAGPVIFFSIYSSITGRGHSFPFNALPILPASVAFVFAFAALPKKLTIKQTVGDSEGNTLPETPVPPKPFYKGISKITYLTAGILVVLAVAWFSYLQPHVSDASVTPELLAKANGPEQQITLSFKAAGLPFSKPEAGLADPYDITKSPYSIEQDYYRNPTEHNDYKPVALTKQGSTYTYTATLNTDQPRTVAFQIKVGTVTQLFRVAVTQRPYDLPPDPGSAGKKTLEGIDSNHDGLRDDIEREIFFAYPESEKIRKAYGELMKANTRIVTSVGTPSEVQRALDDGNRRFNCLTGLSPRERYETRDWNVKYYRIGNLNQNSFKRQRAHSRAMRSVGLQSAPGAYDPLEECNFDYKSLPD